MNLHFNPNRNRNTLGTLGKRDWFVKVARLFTFNGKPNKTLPIKQGKVEGIMVEQFLSLADARRVSAEVIGDNVVIGIAKAA